MTDQLNAKIRELEMQLATAISEKNRIERSSEITSRRLMAVQAVIDDPYFHTGFQSVRRCREVLRSKLFLG